MADLGVGHAGTAVGRPLPASFRSVLLGFSRKVVLYWHLPEEAEQPAEFEEICSGEIGWDLATLPETDGSRREWIDACFPNSDDPYDAIWHGKLAFFSITNGDMLAIDEARDGHPVIYLSHDGGDGHGQMLGKNFADFVTRYSQLGCPGAEDWQWLPFHAREEGALLEPDSPTAKSWRKWFGLTSDAG